MKPPRGTNFILMAMAFTWLAIFFVVPATGFDIRPWKLVVSASVGGVFACLLVFLGESVIEDIVKVAFLLVLAGVLWGEAPELGFILVSALISGVAGAVINQVRQYAAYRRMQSDRPEPNR